MLKHLPPVADKMLALDDGSFDAVLIHQVAQGLLAFNLRKLAEVTITPEKVESVIDEPVLPARGEVCL
jgi:hypothetical protein